VQHSSDLGRKSTTFQVSLFSFKLCKTVKSQLLLRGTILPFLTFDGLQLVCLVLLLNLLLFTSETNFFQECSVCLLERFLQSILVLELKISHYDGFILTSLAPRLSFRKITPCFLFSILKAKIRTSDQIN